jgi:hypothetical protein
MKDDERPRREERRCHQRGGKYLGGLDGWGFSVHGFKIMAKLDKTPSPTDLTPAIANGNTQIVGAFVDYLSTVAGKAVLEDFGVAQMTQGSSWKEPFLLIDQNDNFLRLQYSNQMPERAEIVVPIRTQNDQSLYGPFFDQSGVTRTNADRATAREQCRRVSIAKDRDARGPGQYRKAMRSRTHPAPLMGNGLLRRVDAPIDKLPRCGDELPLPALFGCARGDARQLEIPGGARGSHVGGTDDKASAPPA